MILEKEYHFTPSYYDENGTWIDNPMFNFRFWIESRLHDFYKIHGRIFHPTTIILSGMAMKRLERSCQMNEEFYFGIITKNGKADESYGKAIQDFEGKQHVIAISSEIEGHDDEPVYLYIDEDQENDILKVMYRTEDDDDFGEDEFVDDPDGRLKDEFVHIYGSDYADFIKKEVVTV